MSQKINNVAKKPRAKKRKRNAKVITKIICIIMVAASIVILGGVAKDVIQIMTLKSQSDEVEKELAILRQENVELLQTKEKLEDPNYVTTYARGEYMFSQGDEKLFRLPSKK